MVIIPGLIVLTLLLLVSWLFMSRYFVVIGEKVLEFMSNFFNARRKKGSN